MQVKRLLKLALVDKGIGLVAKGCKHHADRETKRLAENGDRDRDGECGLWACAR